MINNPIEYTTDKYLPQVMASTSLEEMTELMERWNFELRLLKCKK
jgi:hypothetical protein